MKVFLAATSLLPSYGGPAVSVTRLATALSDAGAEVGLWSANGSVNTAALPGHSAVRLLHGSELEALDMFGTPDVLHDNGIWLPHNHRLAALAHDRHIARIVSLRGMLEPWALTHKRFKKKLAWLSYQRRDLRLASCHFTSGEQETRNVTKLRLGVPVVCVPNGVDVPPRTLREPDETGNGHNIKTALVLARLYPVKGLPMLVEAWSRVRPRGWVLMIAGPDEAGHRKQLEKAVSNAGLENVISFIGPVSGRLKQDAFENADLFVLPSHSESFGMAVAEALAHGIPVLTTTGAPWSILPENGCGWWVDANVEGLVSGLRQATSLGRTELHSMGARGRQLMIERFSWNRIANLTLSAYESAMNGRKAQLAMSNVLAG